MTKNILALLASLVSIMMAWPSWVQREAKAPHGLTVLKLNADADIPPREQSDMIENRLSATLQGRIP